MNRKEFEHSIRAAGGVLGENELLVIGSQAIHASVRDVPRMAALSMEADVAAFYDPDEQKADLIDGTIGEVSMFHRTFGYYVEGVSQSTATLPRGWRDRLVRYETPNTNGVVAWRLEVHDLWISKAIANRKKDVEYCQVLLAEGIVSTETLARRLDEVGDIGAKTRRLVAGLIAHP